MQRGQVILKLNPKRFIQIPFFEYPIPAFLYIYSSAPDSENFALLVLAVVMGALAVIFVELVSREISTDLLAGKIKLKSINVVFTTKRAFGARRTVGLPMLIITIFTFFYFLASLWMLANLPGSASQVVLLLLGVGILVATVFIPIYHSREVGLLSRWLKRGRTH